MEVQVIKLYHQMPSSVPVCVYKDFLCFKASGKCQLADGNFLDAICVVFDNPQDIGIIILDLRLHHELYKKPLHKSHVYVLYI